MKFYFLHIVMKVALFYTQKGSESSTFLHEKSYVVLFCIILFHLLGNDCQSVPIFFFVIFLLHQISQLFSICKKIVCTTRYESLFFYLFA
jgi:hypothetical protein